VETVVYWYNNSFSHSFINTHTSSWLFSIVRFNKDTCSSLVHSHKSSQQSSPLKQHQPAATAQLNNAPYQCVSTLKDPIGHNMSPVKKRVKENTPPQRFNNGHRTLTGASSQSTTYRNEYRSGRRPSSHDAPPILSKASRPTITFDAPSPLSVSSSEDTETDSLGDKTTGCIVSLNAVPTSSAASNVCLTSRAISDEKVFQGGKRISVLWRQFNSILYYASKIT